MKKSVGVLLGILMMMVFASSANAEVVLIDKTYSYDSDKYNFPAQYTDPIYGVTIEIKSVQKIEGGIEILARAWKDGKQLGFGKDGSVEIERFRIFNPPILVDDPNGDIVRESIDDKTGEIRRRILREDPIQAIRESLAHTIHLVGKEGTNIVKGKIGSTTSTFYPDPDVESTSVDGLVNNDPVSAVAWATIHDATAGTGAKPSATLDSFARVSCHATSNTYDLITRSFFLFDTSSIPDTDTINSAVLSIKGNGGTDTWTTGTKPNINIVASTPASNTDLVTGDFDQLGTTAFSTAKTTATWSTSAYNDFTLNASGLAAISKTGVSKFGARDMIYDAPNVEPTWASGQQVIFQGNYTDTVGTSSDPKLVVEHGSSDITPPIISAVASSNITSNSATITWTTDESATSQVEYGPTTSYGYQTTLDSNLVTNHSVNLSGLTSNTTYHYRVRSKDASNNESISGDYTFHTVAPLSLRLPFRSGESWHVSQGNNSSPTHNGNEAYAWDFNKDGTSCNGDKGESVFATASGKITYAGWYSDAWGNVIIINYGNGYYGRMAHVLNDQVYPIKVKVGQYVFAGELIGYNGDTGTSAGGCAHIHYQTENASGVSLDPVTNNIKFVDPGVPSNGVPLESGQYVSSNIAPAAIYHLDPIDSSGNSSTIASNPNCFIAACSSFNGTNDYLEASTSLQLNGDFSLVFWLKPENIGTGRINPIEKAYYGEFSLIIENDGSLSYYHGQSTSNYFSWTALGVGAIVNNQAIRVVITRDNASKTLKSYANGSLISTVTYNVDPSTSSNPIRIGLGSTAVPFKGKQDEIAIYPRVLTDDEVNNEYYGSKP